MIGRREFIFAGATLLVGGCTGQSQLSDKGRVSTSSYSGPRVTQIVVSKQHRRMYLLHKDQVIRKYRIGLGFNPVGDKQFVGDGRTPEGRYFIDRRNPDSQFHLSLGISYPNAQDVAEAKALGKDPGGDIFIHGESPKPVRGRDWTYGCISVSNRNIETIYAMVEDGTVIDILP